MTICVEDTLHEQEICLELQGESMEASITKASKHEIDSAQGMPVSEGCSGRGKETLARAVSRQSKEMILRVRAKKRVLIVTTERKLSVRKGVSGTINRD